MTNHLQGYYNESRQVYAGPFASEREAHLAWEAALPPDSPDYPKTDDEYPILGEWRHLPYEASSVYRNGERISWWLSEWGGDYCRPPDPDVQETLSFNVIESPCPPPDTADRWPGSWTYGHAVGTVTIH